MKICMTTLMDDDFFIGFVGFMKSFLQHNPWFDYDFIVFDLDLSEDIKEKMLEYYPKIIFKKIIKSRYMNVNFNKTHDKLKNTFYKLEVFSLFEYDRVVQMDMDMTVVGDVKEIFEATGGLCACQAYCRNKDKLQTRINSGVFVVNKENLNIKTYEGLIHLARKGYTMPDQKVINFYFSDRITYLPKKYNVEKRVYLSNRIKHEWDNAIVLHWIAEKPWQFNKTSDGKKFIEAEKVWWNYYNG